MHKTIFICLIFAGVLTVSGQNKLDEQGRKSGHWKVDHPNGRTLYEADFIDGKPVGEMIRYYENGAVRVRMSFDPSGMRSYARMFYPNGKPAAEGWYMGQQKDSVWTYYSSLDGSVRIREAYQDGQQHGLVRNFYPSGTVSEEIEWANNQKHGNWKQYYQTESLRLSAHYRNDLLNGSYEVYFGNGRIKIKGEFLDNLSHGTWVYYDENEVELISIEYVNGIPADREKYDQWIQDTLEKYQEPMAPESFQFLE